MPIKSVHITNYYHRDSGGISTSYNKLLEAANRHRRYVRLIVPGEQTSIEEYGEFGRIYFIEASHSPIFDKRYRLMMPWKAFMPNGSPVKSILRSEKPDLIEIGEKYTLSLMAGLLRKRLMNVTPRRPILVHSSCERMDDNARSFISSSRIVSWLARQYMGNYNVPMFDFHLSNSNYTLQELVDSTENKDRSTVMSRFSEECWKFWRTPKVDLEERLFINECGVDVDNFSPLRRSIEKRNEVEHRLKVPENKKLLLYAGRLSPEKNLGLLPEMMGKLTEFGNDSFHLIIVGSGPHEESLRVKASKYCPGKITFVGHVSDKNELADIYANSDAFIHPNPREPFGIAPLEAMASGLSLVAPDSGGVLSYADSSNSWLAPPTANDFAWTVIDLHREAGLRDIRIANAVKTTHRYSWQTSTDARFALYDRMYELFSSQRALFDYAIEPIGIDYSV